MERRKLERGQPLDELVKGSLDYTISRLRADFRRQFQDEDDWHYWLAEVFADHVIVEGAELPSDEFYHVPYTRQGERYVFAPREDWEVVELTYRPKTVEEARQEVKQRGRKVVETIETGRMELLESSGAARRIRAVGITADVVNGNGRRYPAPVLAAAVREAQTHLHESLGQGRLLLGEVDHPSSKATRRPNYLETVVKWDAINFAGGQVILEGELLLTSKGRDVVVLLEGGVMPGISQRAYALSTLVDEDGHPVDEVTDLYITGYDLVMEPSDPGAGVLALESQDNGTEEALEAEEDDMKLNLEMLKEKYPDLVQALLEEHDENKKAEIRQILETKQAEQDRKRTIEVEHDAALRGLLGLDESADLTAALRQQAEELQRLRAAEQARKVETYVAEQTQDLPYPEFLKTQFMEAIKSANSTTIDEAKAVITAKRKEYDAIQSNLALNQRGFGVRALGPVIEQELGVPAFARAGWALQESLMESGAAHRWDHRQPRSVNEEYAARYLAHFDQAYRHQLLQETRLFEEAETTADLDLPYSVSRAIIAEAFPMLISASIYDFGLVDRSPFRLYFETFAGETGYDVAVSDEAITADHDAWVNLAQHRLTPGTVVVTNSGATTTYTEGTDYVVDYANGRLMALSTGTITDAQALLADYSYTALRKGEMAPIERGELQLTYKVLDVEADRLAQQVSHEAVVFSRSQLGYDATNRTLASLVRQIRRKIDQGILYMGLAAGLSVASNIVGTWTAATDEVAALIKLIGQAKVKVANRYYEPTGIIVSTTTADLLSNWDGFKRDGFPDAILNATGFVGRVKGLPVFAGTEFSDEYLEVVNRELVMHRVFQAMAIRGPFPSYDVSGGTSKVIAADQYYAEEYNVTAAPVPEKSALVKIA